MEKEKKVVTFSLVECDLVPNGRGKEKNLTLLKVYLSPKNVLTYSQHIFIFVFYYYI